MTARQEILEAIRAITTGREPQIATAQEIVAHLRDRGSSYPESTLRTHLFSHMSDALEKTGRGTFRLRTQEERASQKPSHRKTFRVSHQPASNLILYGPPGTGKTFSVIDEVLKRLAPEHLKSSRQERTAAFEQLRQEGRVEFVTFHQSFTYEDFVEGIKAETTPEGQIRYVVREGIFKTITAHALHLSEAEEPVATPAETLEHPAEAGQVDAFARVHHINLQKAVLKVSIQDGPTLSYCLDHQEVRVPSSQLPVLRLPDQSGFRSEGTLVLLSSGDTEIEAVGVVSGPYHLDAHPPGLVRQDHQHVLPVHWIFTDRPAALQSPADPMTARMVLEHLLHTSSTTVAPPEPTDPEPPGCVLVIDEINRGNISRIFGELITLLEPSRRLGQREALTVRLPYSREDFAVPGNLHILATMNTADRSLTQMDIALRRRFEFREVPPQPALLPENCAGVQVQRMLHAINRRIEVLFDRDHTLGHAYLMPLHHTPTLEHLSSIMQQRILPLLQEYFFEDWSKIRMVLADDQTDKKSEQFVLELQEDHAFTWVPQARSRALYQINPEAFLNVAAYQKIYAGVPESFFEDL